MVIVRADVVLDDAVSSRVTNPRQRAVNETDDLERERGCCGPRASVDSDPRVSVGGRATNVLAEADVREAVSESHRETSGTSVGDSLNLEDTLWVIEDICDGVRGNRVGWPELGKYALQRARVGVCATHEHAQDPGRGDRGCVVVSGHGSVRQWRQKVSIEDVGVVARCDGELTRLLIVRGSSGDADGPESIRRECRSHFVKLRVGLSTRVQPA